MSKNLTDAIVRVYMELLEDDDCPQHLKLGAAKALDAHLARLEGPVSPVSAPVDPNTGEVEALDPLAEMDEVERQRQRRVSA